MDALKVISFLNRRPDMDLAAFSDYWRTTHKAHALTLAEAGFFQGYIQNHSVGAELENLPPIADGSPELWIESPETLQRLVTSREYLEGAGPDEANFSVPPVLACVARERVLIEVEGGSLPTDAIKLMLTVKRNPLLAQTTFGPRWLAGESAPLLAGRPLRLTRHAAEDPEAAFDGAEFSWWPDMDSLRNAWLMRNPADGGELIADRSLHGLLVREEMVLAPCACHAGVPT